MKLEEYLDNNPKKHLIFDFDETIVKLHLDWDIFRNGIKRITNKYDVGLVKKYEKEKLRGIDLMNLGILKYGDPYEEELIDFTIEFEEENLNGESDNQEMINFIKKNADHYKMYIWSSNTLSTIENSLRRLDMFEKFDRIVTREMYSLAKPYTDGFDVIFGDSNYDKSEILMIGDSGSDEQAAENCGIDFYKVAHTFKF